MSAQLNTPGSGTSERQEDWTLYSVTEDFVFKKGSRRKKGFLALELMRLLEAMDENAESCEAPVVPSDLRFFSTEPGNSNFWFVHAAHVADEQGIRLDHPEYGCWWDWADDIEQRLEFQTEWCDPDGRPFIWNGWAAQPSYLGNIKPRNGEPEIPPKPTRSAVYPSI